MGMSMYVRLFLRLGWTVSGLRSGWILVYNRDTMCHCCVSRFSTVTLDWLTALCSSFGVIWHSSGNGVGWYRRIKTFHTCRNESSNNCVLFPSVAHHWQLGVTLPDWSDVQSDVTVISPVNLWSGLQLSLLLIEPSHPPTLPHTTDPRCTGMVMYPP